MILVNVSLASTAFRKEGIRVPSWIIKSRLPAARSGRRGWSRVRGSRKVVFPAYVDLSIDSDLISSSIQPPPRWWSSPPVPLLPRWLVALSLDMTLVIVRTVPVSAALALWWLGFQPLQLPLLSTAMSSVLVLLSSLHASSRENRHRTAEDANPAHRRDSRGMFRVYQ